MDHDFPELIEQLRSRGGPVERLMAEWEVPVGAGLSIPAESPVHQAGYAAASELIEQLRRELGPTGDPSWVDDVVPGRDGTDESGEDDFVFALFRQAPAYVYVRLRGGTRLVASQLRLVVGAVRIPEGHFAQE